MKEGMGFWFVLGEKGGRRDFLSLSFTFNLLRLLLFYFTKLLLVFYLFENAILFQNSVFFHNTDFVLFDVTILAILDLAIKIVGFFGLRADFTCSKVDFPCILFIPVIGSIYDLWIFHISQIALLYFTPHASFLYFTSYVRWSSPVVVACFQIG